MPHESAVQNLKFMENAAQAATRGRCSQLQTLKHMGLDRRTLGSLILDLKQIVIMLSLLFKE